VVVRDITAVLFDFHTTLVGSEDPYEWLSQALDTLDRPPPEDIEAMAEVLSHIWDHANVVDPDSERDLSPAQHREVYRELTDHLRDNHGLGLDDELAEELYRIVADQWHPFADTTPVLRSLAAHGVKLGVLSNIGMDIRGVLTRAGIIDFFDAVVLSYEVGAVKPAADIFLTAAQTLGVEPEDCLMVGDSHVADAGAAAVGIRTLLLPRTPGDVHGLAAVCRLVGAPEPDPSSYGV
jgi:HAD superfamily hydrolase (TIGR01509 family)